MDKGSQISLVKKSDLVRFSECKDKNFQIYRVLGRQIQVKGKVNIMTESTMECLNQTRQFAKKFRYYFMPRLVG